MRLCRLAQRLLTSLSAKQNIGMIYYSYSSATGQHLSENTTQETWSINTVQLFSRIIIILCRVV